MKRKQKRSEILSGLENFVEETQHFYALELKSCTACEFILRHPTTEGLDQRVLWIKGLDTDMDTNGFHSLFLLSLILQNIYFHFFTHSYLETCRAA